MDNHENGMLLFNEDEIKRIGNTNVSGRNSINEKAIIMIAYLIELIYDVAITSVVHISTNPGFETIIGVW